MTTNYTNIAAYHKDVKQKLKQHFRDKRSNEQSLIKEGEKYFNPVTKAQKEVSREILESLNKNQENITNSLVPYTRNLERRIDQVEDLHSLPYYNAPLEGLEGISQSTPIKEGFTKNIDLDNGLNDTDKENLSIFYLDLPSDVLKKGTHIATLQKLSGCEIKIGKVLSEKDKKGKKSSGGEKEIAKSQKETFKKYRDRINLIKSAYKEEVFGDGLEIKDMNNDDLIKILHETTNDIGNSKIGLTALDELLKRRLIDDNKYKKVVMTYFSKRQRGRPRKEKLDK
jgi:hypothetical protein